MLVNNPHSQICHTSVFPEPVGLLWHVLRASSRLLPVSKAQVLLQLCPEEGQQNKKVKLKKKERKKRKKETNERTNWCFSLHCSWYLLNKCTEGSQNWYLNFKRGYWFNGQNHTSFIFRSLTASSASSSSVLTMKGQNPFMCFILKNETCGTLPSCFIRSRVQVLAVLAPRGIRVKSKHKSPKNKTNTSIQTNVIDERYRVCIGLKDRHLSHFNGHLSTTLN